MFRVAAIRWCSHRSVSGGTRVRAMGSVWSRPPSTCDKERGEGNRERERGREGERERGEGDDKRERVVMSPEPAWDYCHGLSAISFRWPQLLAARDRLGALKLGSSAAPACPDYPHLFHKIRIAPRPLLNQLHLLPSWSPNHTVWSVARSVPLSVQPVPLLAT